MVKMAKKFLFVLTLIFALSFSAWAFGATVITVKTNPAALQFTGEDVKNESGDVTFTHYTLTGPYEFSTIKGALEFASDPQGYLDTNFQATDSDDHKVGTDDFSNIEIKLENDNLLGGAVTLSNYSLSSLLITGNSHKITSTGSRDITLNGSMTFEINGLTIEGNNSLGGIELGASTGSATFTNVTFQNIKDSSVDGGAVKISGGSGITFTGCIFSGCEGNNGGAIYTSNGTITVDGCTFNTNTATVDGGAMCIAGGTLTFSNANIFTSNTAATNGGAVAVKSGSITLSQGTFTTNNAASGGALYSSTTGTLTVDADVKFTNNTATNGATIYIAKGTANINSDITGVNTTTNGGAVYIYDGTVNINGNLNTNIVSGDGGAIYVYDGTVNVYGSLKSNEATNGGAVYIADGTVNIYSSQDITKNKASNNGGAVCIAASDTATLNLASSSTGNFSSNSAGKDGGAIYAGSGSKIIFTSETNFTSNTATRDGGAIWLGTSSQLSRMTGTVRFNSNMAGSVSNQVGNGGAICIGDSTTSTGVTLNSDHGFVFNENTAGALGGAIYTYSSDITFDGVTVDYVNTAGVGGGFAASGSGRITIQNSSKISKQTAPTGGAIYGGNIVVDSSDFTANTSTGTNGTKDGGGAIYASGQLTLTKAYFYNNKADQEGGAVFVSLNPDTKGTVTVEDSFFLSNRVEAGNGGAMNLANTSLITIKTSTFRDNRSIGMDGGALYIQGDKPEIDNSYFVENYAKHYGGAIYYNQTKPGDNNPVFSMTSSMIEGNSASEGYGGGVYIMSNGAKIDSCTFANNELVATSEAGYGGALYLDTEGSEMIHNTIDNCTFVGNRIDGGTSGSAGGGALAVKCEQTTIRSCTFTSNESLYKGGAILGAEGRFIVAGVIAVGNTIVGTYDIWIDSSISSNGYNRIGVFGQGSGVTDFYSVTRQDTDRTAFPSKNWTRASFFSSNELADNIRTDLTGDIPPYIGSTREGQIRLQTLMLSEDVTLPLVDRATNIIPYAARNRFPDKDERGVTRFPGGNRNFKADIGAVYFDGTRLSEEDSTTITKSIRTIQISGIPNHLTQVGQSVTLIAKIYYTNGTTAYGVAKKSDSTNEAEEVVKWSVSGDGATCVTLSADVGILTVTKTSTRALATTITVSTTRSDASSNKSASKSFYVGGSVSGAGSGGLGTSSPINAAPGANSYNTELIRELTREFIGFEVGYGYYNTVNGVILTSTFVSSTTRIWGINSASLITDFSEIQPSVMASTNNVASSGFSTLQETGVSINMQDVEEGEMLPLTYPCDLSGTDLKGILGSEVYDSVASDLLAASQNDSTVSDETAKKIFSSLRVEFKDKNGNIWPVIGAGTNVDLIKALDCEAIILSADNNLSGGIHFDLNTCIMNADATQNSEIAAADSTYDGPQLVGEEGLELLIIPDGVNDNEISGTIWVAQKDLQGSTAQSQTVSSDESISQNSSTSDSNKDSGGGGGGCELFNIGIFAVLMFALKRKLN